MVRIFKESDSNFEKKKKVQIIQIYNKKKNIIEKKKTKE